MNLIDRDVLIDNADELDARREDPLVRAVQAGVPEAFAQLYAIYSPRLYRTITKITKNPEDAQDVLQETFLRAHLRVQAFEGRSSIYSWLSRIAINCALMILRKRRTRPEVLFDPQPNHRGCETTFFEVKDSAPNPEEAYDLRQRQARTLRAIRRLDPKLQAALRMQMKYEWSVKEISQALSISEAAAKSRLYRARQQLSTRNAHHTSFAIHHLQSHSATVTRDTLLSASAKASTDCLIHD
jgi:RNA polymerase sigma-70 factor, ECF subfamily